jgi:flavin-dependent thymidylate synthase
MNISLISVTHDALTLLLRTKNTRMSFAEDPGTWSEERRTEHLAYMRDTIKSSWEFVDYVFQIEGVTRVFTHQLVRTRSGSYAQQSQRITDVSDLDVQMPESVQAADAWVGARWEIEVDRIREAYKNFVAYGIPMQDARGLMPANTETSITAKFTLRGLHEMAKLRLCTRTQGEYQEVFREMRRLVIEEHPWAEQFINVHCASEGTCAFPRYGKVECPVYDPAMDQSEVRERAHKVFWAVRHVAAPVAKDGKAA